MFAPVGVFCTWAMGPVAVEFVGTPGKPPPPGPPGPVMIWASAAEGMASAAMTNRSFFMLGCPCSLIVSRLAARSSGEEDDNAAATGSADDASPARSTDAAEACGALRGQGVTLDVYRDASFADVGDGRGGAGNLR